MRKREHKFILPFFISLLAVTISIFHLWFERLATMSNLGIILAAFAVGAGIVNTIYSSAFMLTESLLDKRDDNSCNSCHQSKNCND